MNGEELFEIWAPEESPWSRWAKPVLFAQHKPILMNLPGEGPLPAFESGWAPPPASGKALVVDLPAEQSVHAGIVLAGRGYRPVPLYNVCTGFNEVVPTGRILQALYRAASPLAQLRLPPEAPPVFLLDSLRAGQGASPAPGLFDNRWVALPQDFPSANVLLSAGVQTVLVVQRAVNYPRPDLAHVLRRWQQAGIKIQVKSTEDTRPAQDVVVAKPSAFGSVWYRWLALLGLRRNSAGGFGAVVPEPGASTGYG